MLDGLCKTSKFSLFFIAENVGVGMRSGLNKPDLRNLDVDAIASARSTLIFGLILIIFGNSFNFSWMKIDVDGLVVNLGSLISFIWVAQSLFDSRARDRLFNEIRSEAIGSVKIASSGIIDFSENSHRVDLSDKIKNSRVLIVGVNHSAKIISNNLDSFLDRAQLGCEVKVVAVNPNSIAAKFLEEQQATTVIESSKDKMISVLRDIQGRGAKVEFYLSNVIMKYAFMVFDDCIWIVLGTNSTGRKSVPGFMVKKDSSWWRHFDEDIQGVVNGSEKQNI